MTLSQELTIMETSPRISCPVGNSLFDGWLALVVRASSKSNAYDLVKRIYALQEAYQKQILTEYKYARKLRTPKWADLKAIEAFYAARPSGYHVDHIIPLRGENVSGLHVLENLQYLLAFENCSKGNKYEQET